jgi:hypothetical protein
MGTEIETQHTNRTIMHFCCWEREKKRKNKKKLSSAAMQQLSNYTRHIMW